MLKASRETERKQMHLHLESILTSFTRAKETGQARDMRPGSDEESIYAMMTGPNVRHMLGSAFRASSIDNIKDHIDPHMA